MLVHPDSNLVHQAARELQELHELENSQAGTPVNKHNRFPPSCLKLLRGIDGNLRCADCDATNPCWASVTYGAMLCIDCSGSHRQLGVQISVVRSISMDSWSYVEVLSMLEGGNKQMNEFFVRHGLPSPHMSDDDESIMTGRNRYKTNAAMFYRDNLSQHIGRVHQRGLYKGRDHYRKVKKARRKIKKETTEKSSHSNKTSTCAVECTLSPSTSEPQLALLGDKNI